MACNTGVSWTPTVAGERLEFRAAGLYNGLGFVEDTKTGSYWDHITGESVHGELRGAELAEGPTLEYWGAAQAARRYPNAELALSRPTLLSRILHTALLRRMLSRTGHLPLMLFGPSLEHEDERRPRMELGLGVYDVEGGSRCFYPLDTIRAAKGALVDAERGLLVYIDPESGIPVAARVDASSCRFDDDELVLDTGERIRDRQLVGANEAARPLDQPAQLFTRWYGFALTFPGCAVYDHPDRDLDQRSQRSQRSSTLGGGVTVDL